MKNKKVVIMIVVVLCVLGSQFLGAGQECGYTIYPGIKIPGPSLKMPGSKVVGAETIFKKSTLVWSETVFQFGAKWLKIHFSEFSLNDDSYVDLIGMNGTMAVRIKGSDVSDDKKSRYKVKKSSDNKVSFWGPAVDGDTIIIELHRGTGKPMVNKFTIDEVGVGIEPLKEDFAIIESICGTNNLQHIVCYYGYEPYDRGQAVGRTYFQKNGYWYMENGFLCSCKNSNTFLTSSYRIDSQSVVDTLEVRFGYQFSNCDGTGYLMYNANATYCGDLYIKSDSNKHYCLLTLKDDPAQDFPPLEPLNRDPVLNEDIYLVEHPNGDAKMIGFSNVSSTGGSGLYFEHYVDTVYGGSMGSPVLTDDVNNLDKVLGFDYFGNCPNAAVKISKIYADIKDYIGCN